MSEFDHNYGPLKNAGLSIHTKDCKKQNEKQQ